MYKVSLIKVQGWSNHIHFSKKFSLVRELLVKHITKQYPDFYNHKYICEYSREDKYS